jgi:prepilin signal peptidase PulO-like enzyme (type II secretory pathway)
VVFELAVFLCFLRIAIFDFKNHLIRNIDLLIVAIFAFPLYWRNLWIALANLSIYLFIWLINKGKLGVGDVYLSFFCALLYPSFQVLCYSTGIAWILGGISSLREPKKAIPFAPFMIGGSYLAIFLVPTG